MSVTLSLERQGQFRVALSLRVSLLQLPPVGDACTMRLTSVKLQISNTLTTRHGSALYIKDLDPRVSKSGF